ncbi:MAG TPA: hypothetical protein VK795_03390 [Terriglobales bacterium]|nr:hypothetical protein [Terriglobales bacterium]
MKKIMFGVLVATSLCLMQSPATHAQAAASQGSGAAASNAQVQDQDIQLLRQDIRSKKKQLIAANLTLTDAESTKFWPLYDQYTAELVKINNAKYDLIKEYANNYSTLTDAQADSMTKRLLGVDLSVAQLREKYLPLYRAILSAKTTATYFQIERRISMMIDLQLASQIPLVQSQQ